MDLLPSLIAAGRRGRGAGFERSLRDLVGRARESGLAVVALLHLAGRSSGQNVVEYGLLMASIVVVVLVAVTEFENLIQPWFMSLEGRITTAT